MWSEDRFLKGSWASNPDISAEWDTNSWFENLVKPVFRSWALCCQQRLNLQVMIHKTWTFVEGAMKDVQHPPLPKSLICLAMYSWPAFKIAYIYSQKATQYIAYLGTLWYVMLSLYFFKTTSCFNSFGDLTASTFQCNKLAVHETSAYR